MIQIKSVQQHANAEIIIGKSKFIADIFPVNSYEEAISILQGIQSRHPKANHHCYAYIIGNNLEQQRFNDDGEPSGTAGMPILNVLNHENLTNLIAIVTRYFGGVKLGTGGLVRAYTTAVKIGLQQAKIITKSSKDLYEIRINYTLADRIKYLLQNKAIINAISYEEEVRISFFLCREMKASIEEELKNLSKQTVLLKYIKSSYI